MKKFLFLLFAVCTFTANAQKVSSFHHNEGRIKEPVHNMFVKPMVADIQILPNPDAGICQLRGEPYHCIAALL